MSASLYTVKQNKKGERKNTDITVMNFNKRDRFTLQCNGIFDNDIYKQDIMVLVTSLYPIRFSNL